MKPRETAGIPSQMNFRIDNPGSFNFLSFLRGKSKIMEYVSGEEYTLDIDLDQVVHAMMAEAIGSAGRGSEQVSRRSPA